MHHFFAITAFEVKSLPNTKQTILREFYNQIHAFLDDFHHQCHKYSPTATDNCQLLTELFTFYSTSFSHLQYCAMKSNSGVSQKFKVKLR